MSKIIKDGVVYGASPDLSGYATKSEVNNKAGKTVASVSANGLMSASDKSKLDGINKKYGNYRTPPVISFIDDDCRLEWFNDVFPLVQELQIPYTVACPTSKIGNNNYMTADNLTTAYNSGLISIACHTTTEINMDTKTSMELDKILTNCDTWFGNHSFDVRTYAYCQGAWTKANVRNVVRRHYDAGFLVDKGINYIPFEQYNLKRVGIYQASTASNIIKVDGIKTYIDDVYANGGWLIIMTHAWNDTFQADSDSSGTKDGVEGLRQIVEYINGKNIQIKDIHEVLLSLGNEVTYGNFVKGGSDPYFVVDCLGRTWTNTGVQFNSANASADTIEDVFGDSSGGGTDEPDTETWTTLTGTLYNGYYIGKETSTSYKGKLLESVNHTTANDKYKVLSVDITGYSSVKVTGYAYSGYGVYSFLDSSGTAISTYWSTNSSADGGNPLNSVEVAVPTGAATLLVAGHTTTLAPAVEGKAR